MYIPPFHIDQRSNSLDNYVFGLQINKVVIPGKLKYGMSKHVKLPYF